MAQADSDFRTVGVARLAIGAVQGVLLWAVVHQVWDHKPADHVWQAEHPALFAALVLGIAFAPVVVLAGLGQLRRATLVVWSLAAAVILFALGWYAGWRGDIQPDQIWPSPWTFPMAGAALFIAHHLIAPADEHRRLRAPYPAYFDIASKHAVQLGLSVAFTGAFWLLLHLGAALFSVIGLKGFEHLIEKEWFFIPASTIVFAAAVQLTDVRSGMVQGIRMVGLTLLSWLMPLMAAIAVAFLPSLLFTGLKPLFGTGNATELLLGTAGALIILINAAYQDGEAEVARPAVLRWGARASALVLVPLILLAAYALALRIGEHGLTPERVFAAACVIVGVGFTIGYVLAAVRRGPWMQKLEPTNIYTGYLALAVLLLLLSPIGDPARISVAEQMHRLKSGQIAADKFDYGFLRFEGARFGRKALAELAASKNQTIAGRASAAQKLENRYEGEAHPPTQWVTFPAGRVVPQEILQGKVLGGPQPCEAGGRCVVIFADLDGDGKEEIAVFGTAVGAELSMRDGRWEAVGGLAILCAGDQDALAKGDFKIVPPIRREIEVNGRVLPSTVWAPEGCPGQSGVSGASVTVPVTFRLGDEEPPASPAPRAEAPRPGR